MKKSRCRDFIWDPIVRNTDLCGRQFAVKPAFVSTANESGGRTTSGKVAIHSWEDCFSRGQLHVATSRATHPSRWRFYVKDSAVGTK